ncbi:RecB family exonuclease [Nakamurella flavida]|uniref:RecB family exonuclease n=2 Tax=Nakamurella flavida TaxID=363630 RepID=A0A938YM16_9ACTN|nr:RecB family exonuclease [Nakamurella flavida]
MDGTPPSGSSTGGPRPTGPPVSPRVPTGSRPIEPPTTSPADPPPARRPLALSPSRAADFKQCPLLYRLRAIDRLAEPPSAPAVRGTLVHAVLEGLFGRPAVERTRDEAVAAVRPAWSTLAEQRPDVAEVVPAAELDDWLASAEALVDTYFALEDPRRLTPEACELGLDLVVDGDLPLRGFVDRVDVSPTGLIRVVDYKTGRSPRPDLEASALYQLKFYALMIFRSRGVVPAQLKLIYLGDGVTLTTTTSEAELVIFERSVRALWAAMTAAVTTGDFPASPGRGCSWCTHTAVCPAFDGTPPSYPADLVPELLAPPASEE